MKEVEKKEFRVALTGNPNSGKTSIFNHLTGLNQKTANYPGITVELKEGKLTAGNLSSITIIDTPGLYNLYPSSEDEIVTVNLILNNETKPDAIIFVADATQLERQLVLFSQLRDLHIPLVLAISMTDISRDKGTEIDVEAIEKELNVPCVEINGRTGKEKGLICEAIEKIADKNDAQQQPDFINLGSYPVTPGLKIFENKTEYEKLAIINNKKHISSLSKEEVQAINEWEKEENIQPVALQVSEIISRSNKVKQILHKVVKEKKEQEKRFTEKLDKVLVHHIWGPIVFFIILGVVFQSVFTWASYPMDAIDTLTSWGVEGIKKLLPEHWVTNLITDGMMAGVGGIIIFIPQIAFLFLFIGVLEDTGYMTRVTFIFDRLLRKFGLNGRSVVAMVSGFACAIPAILSARTITNRKEKLATILITPFMSCAARLPVYTILIALAIPNIYIWKVFNLQGIVMISLYLLGVVVALVFAYILKKVLKLKEEDVFLIELPEYRNPHWKKIFLTVLEKVKIFTLEAGKIILIISIALWFLANYGFDNDMQEAEAKALSNIEQQNLSTEKAEYIIASKKLEASYIGKLGKLIEPAFKPLGYDWKITVGILTSFAAREVFVGTMSTLYAIENQDDDTSIIQNLSKAQNENTGMSAFTLPVSCSLLIFFAFAMQCMSTLAIVKRETNTWKWPIVQLVTMTVVAYFSAMGVYNFLS